MVPRIVFIVLAVSLLSFALVPAPAQAVLITVQFTVARGPGDSGSPPTGSGSFSFDDSLIPPEGGDLVIISGIPISSASFNWAGTSWTTANSAVDVLHFSSSGELLGFRYRGGSTAGVVDNPDFLVRRFPDGSGLANTFEYRYGGRFYTGSFLSWSTDQGSAPEPAAWWLFATACLGMAVSRRRLRLR